MARNIAFRGRGWRSGDGFSTGEIWFVLLAGIFLGLGYAFFPQLPQSAPEAQLPSIIEAPAEVPDPWAESKRSRAILEAQEGAPPSARPERRSAMTSSRAANLIQPHEVTIIDGDTIRYRGQKIRIADIDTPEIFSPQCASEKALGMRATRRMGELIAAGPFELHGAGSRDSDRYGRKLRIAVRGGRSLGDQLVSEGLARTWSGRREGWC